MGVLTDEPRVQQPVARRVRRPSWRDPRLVLGCVLVAGAAVVGSLVVAGADETVPVLVAGSTLVAGDGVSADDLRAVRVRLDAVAPAYLPADAVLGEGVVALRTVAAGELVPAAALGARDELRTRPIAVPLAGARTEGLVRGAQVDVWVAERRAASDYEPPELVVAAAAVHGVTEGTSGLSSSSGTQVQVLLEPDGVQRVLGAMADGDRVDLVLVPGSAPSP